MEVPKINENIANYDFNRNGKQNKKETQFKSSEKEKIQFLHRMLDNQISTVNTLFEKDSAFDQIQNKLRMLQVKLNSIKDDTNPVNVNYLQTNQKKNSFCVSTNSHADQYSSIKSLDETPFESLSKYKLTKKLNKQKAQEQKTVSKSKKNIKKENNDFSHSGKKLNFDNVQDDSLNQQNENKRKIKKKKIRSETVLKHEQKNSRSHSLKEKTNAHKDHKSSTKMMTRQSSSSKTKISKIPQKIAKQRINSSSKKLNNSKTANTLYRWKDIAHVYQRVKQKQDLDSQRKEKVKEVIRKSEAKRLQRQLSMYKMKNESLNQQIAELKSYKNQFQKLKSIFEKDQKIKKSRKKL